MSKNFYLSIFFGFFFNVILGQNPIQWITNTEKINDSTYNLTTTAKIENNWRLYSQYNEEGGAILTEFIFSDSLIIKNYSRQSFNFVIFIIGFVLNIDTIINFCKRWVIKLQWCVFFICIIIPFILFYFI